MKSKTLVNSSENPSAMYVSWALSPCEIRLADPTGVTQDVPVTLQAVGTAAGGRIVLRATASSPPRSSLNLTLPLDGKTVPFFISGDYGHPSLDDHDVSLQIRAGTTKLEEIPLMVRIRKNAATLTTQERDRFVSAMAKLNNQGTGRFADFRDMHTAASAPQAHGAQGFLPWHRAYLLDLERELQAIDPSVALPYWRFDQPAPFIFTPDFLGSSNNLGRVQFSATNPLQFWKTDGVQGVLRRPLFSTAGAPTNGLLNESQTLALGSTYTAFRGMEEDPHGYAHTSFGGSISSVPTAAKDPLFFLLHANVDRMWAKWQRKFGRFDSTQAASYESNANTGGNPVGHNLGDTMWPWNGVTTPPRPPTAPGGTLASSPCVHAPGPSPEVKACLDFQGIVQAAGRLGFDYDDVKFK